MNAVATHSPVVSHPTSRYCALSSMPFDLALSSSLYPFQRLSACCSLALFPLTSPFHSSSGPYGGTTPTPCHHITATTLQPPHHSHSTNGDAVPSNPKAEAAPPLQGLDEHRRLCPPPAPLPLRPLWMGKSAVHATMTTRSSRFLCGVQYVSPALPPSSVCFAATLSRTPHLAPHALRVRLA